MTHQTAHTALGEEWLVDYAAGNLSPAYAAVAECFLDLNEDRRKTVDELERVGGALLDTADAGAGLSVAAADLLAREGDSPEVQAQKSQCPDYIPGSLREKFDLDRNGIKWTFLGPGLQKALLWKGSNDDRLWLLKAEPGVAIPNHTHRGAELTLVLKGEIRDGEDIFGVGDVEEADHDLTHTIRVSSEESCICLAATKGRLIFPAPLIKMMQIFLDI